MTESRRAFVCGFPVSHSRSPLIHGYWIDSYGIGGSYERIERAPADFPAFIAGLAGLGFAGGNVTIPHKEAAFAACEAVDETARRIGAVNTVWMAHGRLHGTNTDAYGFAANLDECAEGWDSARVAVVLGAGGAARAVIHALLERGFSDVRIVNRTAGRAVEISDRFGDRTSAHAWRDLPDLFGDAGFVVNTTSLGMDVADAEVPGLDPLPSDAIVTDIVYAPLVTPLLRIARARGLRTVDGLGMLLHQAAPGFERWFGQRPVVTPELRSLVERDLGVA